MLLSTSIIFYLFKNDRKISVFTFRLLASSLVMLAIMPVLNQQNLFSNTVALAQGYDAGYYVYTWAAVLDNDAFEAFREKGIFDQETAASFRTNILEKIGTMDAEQQYLNFRGREPQIEPLLKNRGLN